MTAPTRIASRRRRRDATGVVAAARLEPRGRRRLSVSVINFWIDALAARHPLRSSGWVSAMLQFVFPAPTAAAGWSLWGLGYDQWHDLQFAVLCLFAARRSSLHVMMHWNWVCSVIATQIVRSRERPDEGMQTIYGVATLIVLLHLIGAGVDRGDVLRAPTSAVRRGSTPAHPVQPHPVVSVPAGKSARKKTPICRIRIPGPS